jgi:hypothetical protein
LRAPEYVVLCTHELLTFLCENPKTLVPYRLGIQKTKVYLHLDEDRLRSSIPR